MANKKLKDIYTLTNFTVEEITNLYNINELEILLYIEPDIQEVDLMLENLELYLIEKQEFEKCCVIRDERDRRFRRTEHKTNYIK